MKRTVLMILPLFWSGLVWAQSKSIKHVPQKNSGEANFVYVEDGGKFVETNDYVITVPGKNDIFQVVEVQPKFPGGMEALIKYIKDNVRYPAICKEQKIQGRVIVQFVVNPDSTISDVQVIKPVNPHLDKEAVRVVKAMPKWEPGKQRGEAVKVRFTLPVTFRLPKEETATADSLAASTNK